MRKLAILLFGVVSIACNRNQDNAELQELSAMRLCALEQDDKPIGEVNSMTVVNDSILLLTTGSDVMQYSVSGKYIGDFGYKGRAIGEYSMPMKVRSDGENIYVWDAMGLKFLRYDKDANFVDEYPYPSALKDFILCEDKIVIYTAGIREDSLIDIYDTDSKTIVKSLTESSPSQRVFNSISTYPVCIDHGTLYYMPCCELKLYTYDLNKDDEEKCLCTIKSDSFNVPKVNDEEALLSKRSKLSKFYDEASSVLMVAPMNNGFEILTCEGVYYRENGQRKFDKRHYVFYQIDENGKVIARNEIPYDNFESKSAVSLCGDNLYFLKKHTTDNEESHILFRHTFALDKRGQI